MKLLTAQIALLCTAAILSGCASGPSEPTEEAPPPPLSDEAFKSLRDPLRFNTADSFKKGSSKRADDGITLMIARRDLTTNQRAQLYQDRGFLRGLFVRDHAMAFPQCAVVDYREMERLAPDHPNLDEMKKNREYQFYRFQYFSDAPADCVAGAEAYRREIGDCLGLRDSNGACIVEWR